MQLEVGELGTPHYQGGVYFKSQIYFSTMKQLSKVISWKIVGNWKKTILYCTKPETRVAGPWSKGIDLSHTISSMPDPTGWQLDLLKLISGPRILEKYTGFGKVKEIVVSLLWELG